jgi:hypothetical protein
MSSTNSQTKKTVTRQANLTRGNITRFDRPSFNYMKKELKLSETELLSMSAAICPAKVNGNNANLIRYFKTEIDKEKGSTIADYESLGEYPELILYEGYRVDGKGGEIIIKKKEGAGTSLIEEKIKKGEITQVGVVIEKSASQKWLGRIGHFMMMGGFLLVIIVVVIIVILINVLVKC